MRDLPALARTAWPDSVPGRISAAFQRSWQTSLLRALFVWLLTRPYPYLSSKAHLALQRENVFFVPANPGTLAYKQMAGKNVVLFDAAPAFTAEERSALLDRWLQNVRFK